MEQGTCGKNLTWTLDGDTLNISGEGDMENYEVHEGETPWFDKRDSIKKIIICDSVTSIGDSAFEGCENLTTIKIPDSVTSIGEFAFNDCENLTTIKIPDSVTSIGGRAFLYCKNLRAINIPSSVTSIGEFAFSSCENLTEIIIPDGITSIGKDAFSDCKNLRAINIPDSVTSIGGGAFCNCTSLINISSPSKKYFKDKQLVYERINSSDVRINSVIDTNIESIDIPARVNNLSVTEIGEETFFYCHNLKKINIPNSITKIGDGAFSGGLFGRNFLNQGEGLTEIKIPDGVTFIGKEAFHGCRDLKEIKIPNGVTKIGEGTFFWCESLTEIKIPDGVTFIGKEAFYACRDLKEIKIPNGVTKIGEEAFKNCENLTTIKIPDSVTSIGGGAFCNCTSLTNITLPSKKYFKDKQLVYERINSSNVRINSVIDTNIKSIDIPAKVNNLSVTEIDNHAFKHCENLTTITIPDGVNKIGDEAFRNCKSLQEIKIPDGVTSIGDSAFLGCESLKEITIPDSVTSIGRNAFCWCEKLAEVKLPDNITFIDSQTFESCNFSKITIPDNVNKIGLWAFKSCASLTETTIPENVTEIGNGVFGGCTSLRKIYYRAGSGFETKLAAGNNAELVPVTPKIPAWRVENLTLTVGGTDKIKDYSKETPPWHDYLKTIQRIVIEDGVKKISANAFSNVLRLEHVTIPASVKTIGDFAFTISYCGERTIDGGKNVIWSLDDGKLIIKKNPAAKSDADFSTGYETWNVIEKNITGVEIERGVIPSKNFFEWLARMDNSIKVSF